jgi:hypothetical protein
VEDRFIPHRARFDQTFFGGLRSSAPFTHKKSHRVSLDAE